MFFRMFKQKCFRFTEIFNRVSFDTFRFPDANASLLRIELSFASFAIRTSVSFVSPFDQP